MKKPPPPTRGEEEVVRAVQAFAFLFMSLVAACIYTGLNWRCSFKDHNTLSSISGNSSHFEFVFLVLISFAGTMHLLRATSPADYLLDCPWVQFAYIRPWCLFCAVPPAICAVCRLTLYLVTPMSLLGLGMVPSVTGTVWEEAHTVLGTIFFFTGQILLWSKIGQASGARRHYYLVRASAATTLFCVFISLFLAQQMQPDTNRVTLFVFRDHWFASLVAPLQRSPHLLNFTTAAMEITFVMTIFLVVFDKVSRRSLCTFCWYELPKAPLCASLSMIIPPADSGVMCGLKCE
eukprot:gene6545-1166_t